MPPCPPLHTPWTVRVVSDYSNISTVCLYYTKEVNGLPVFLQVNMPVDSFESPLTLAACGGHYELAALLISRGADLEEVNDEG